MNQSRDQTDDDLAPVMKEALHWVVRLTSGAATEADAHAFRQWRTQGPAHEDAFREAAAFRKAVRAMDLSRPVEAPADPVDNVVPFRRPASRPALIDRRAMLFGGGAIAASAVAVMIARPPLGLWPSFAELTADYRTGIGERRALALADGAKVELNGRSALSIINDRGGISLVAGEAFVAVPGASKPFLVEAGDERFAVGAATFNLRTSARETCITCLTGAMQQQNGSNPVRLAAGQQLIVRPNGEAELARIDPVRVLGWRQGLLIFRNTPLAEAIEDINRYRSARIILTDNALAHRPVNGMFHTDQIENAVVQIQQLLHVNARHLPGGVTLLG